MDYVILTPTELTLCREKAAPTIHKVTDLLLRGGAIGFMDMQRNLLSASEEEGKNSQEKKRRVNPVLFKSIMNKSGVLLTPDEYRNLRTAYSDEGGFLVEEFIELVSPLKSLSVYEYKILQEMCADVINSANKSYFILEDLMHILIDAFSPNNKEEDYVYSDKNNKEEDYVYSDKIIKETALMELQTVFTQSRYPNGIIPLNDFMNAFAAIILNNKNNNESFLKYLSTLKLPAVPSSVTSTELPFHFTGTRTSKVKQPRGYDYYTDRDNRDEWIKGREEIPPSSMYLRHLPGFQGHIPTYIYKFGRSFHPIEESAPELSKKKEEFGPIPPDRYGAAVELKGTWLNRHHFKLA